MPIQSYNPYTNTIEKTFKEFSQEKIKQLIGQANTVFLEWKKTDAYFE